MPSNTQPTPILALAQSVIAETPKHRPRLEEKARRPPAFASDPTRARFETWAATLTDVAAANASWQQQVEELQGGRFRERILDPETSPAQLRKFKRDVEDQTLLALRRLHVARVDFAAILETLLDENTAAIAAAKAEMDEARAGDRDHGRERRG